MKHVYDGLRARGTNILNLRCMCFARKIVIKMLSAAHSGIPYVPETVSLKMTSGMVRND